MRMKLRKPFILSTEVGWMIYDYVDGGSTCRCGGDGEALVFPDRDAAREFLGLAPGRRHIEEFSCSEDIGGGDVG